MKDYIYTIGAVLPMLIITWYSSSLLDERWEEYRILQEQLWECQDDGMGDGTFRTHVTLTMYHPTRGQTDSTPKITEDGTS